MIQFQNDYNEGCHPLILRRLVETNWEQTCGYGEDAWCEKARELVRKVCDAPDAEVHFLVGGTQTNATVISSVLRPYQGVLCAETGHINVHETGAIEHGGHKVLALSAVDGKITARQVADAIDGHYSDANHEHMVQPGLVYLSFSTELGTIYSLRELTAISEVCHSRAVPLFIDGARLGYGLTCSACDVTLPDIARLADIFYIGGTKQGALFGEAVVITDKALGIDFRYCIKQGGGMLAKGRLLGIQFATLLENNLYFDIAAHANRMAERIRRAFVTKGIRFLVDSPTNQQFPILTEQQHALLSREFLSDWWCRVDANHAAVRFCTSWATREENVERLCAVINAL
jgi:threonine aldolase